MLLVEIKQPAACSLSRQWPLGRNLAGASSPCVRHLPSGSGRQASLSNFGHLILGVGAALGDDAAYDVCPAFGAVQELAALSAIDAGVRAGRCDCRYVRDRRKIAIVGLRLCDPVCAARADHTSCVQRTDDSMGPPDLLIAHWGGCCSV